MRKWQYILGAINVNVKHVNENKRLSLIVGKGDGPSLLERDWLMLLKLNWKAIYLTVREKLEDCLSVTLDNHSTDSSLFKEALGTVQGEKAKLHTNPQILPKFVNHDKFHSH